MVLANPIRHSGAGEAGTRNPDDVCDEKMDSGFALRAPRNDNVPDSTKYCAKLGSGTSRWLIPLMLLLLGLTATACETKAGKPDSKANSAISRTSFSQSSYARSDALCLARESYQGCCSKNLGMKYFEGRHLICKNEDISPTCTSPRNADLRGCCRGNNGIKNISSDGIVTCRNGNVSPTCRIKTCSS